MRNIEEMAWLSKPTLRLIESRNTDGLNRFSLTLKQDKPDSAEAEEE
jgi:hypothetical protein